MQVGALSALGLGLGSYCDRANAAAAAARAKACILIWLDGGPSHLETLDPKPQATREVRGPFKAISTSVAGIQLSELMPSGGGLQGT